jgi:hypothetical protein
MAVVMNAKTQSWEFLLASFMVIIIRPDSHLYSLLSIRVAFVSPSTWQISYIGLGK